MPDDISDVLATLDTLAKLRFLNSLDESLANDVLLPDYPEELIDKELRKAGFDPEEVAREGAELASNLLTKRKRKLIFVDNGDGTVTDTKLHLMWQKKTDDRLHTWSGALYYCKALPLAGHEDWRLPTIEELLSIIDYGARNPAIDKELFPGTIVSYYWTSTNYYSHKELMWQVDFHSGKVDYRHHHNYAYVRAVRSASKENQEGDQ